MQLADIKIAIDGCHSKGWIQEIKALCYAHGKVCIRYSIPLIREKFIAKRVEVRDVLSFPCMWDIHERGYTDDIIETRTLLRYKYIVRMYFPNVKDY
jgi:hypothetical protein